MSDVTNTINHQAVYGNSNVTQAQEASKNEKTNKSIYGKSVGEPQLSEKAVKYYESLKSKFGNMDFVLVSKDQKAKAQANAAQYANKNKMVVLIDEEKIEKMATDESYRKKYEEIIAQSASGMSDFAKKLGESGANIKGFGMQVNDNGATSFFAVMKKSAEKSMSDQKARIDKKAAANRAAKKAEAKKEAKKAEEKRLEKHRGEDSRIKDEEDEETVTITANSMEELLQKIDDQKQLWMSDDVQTEAEKQVGQNFDFSV